jgi:hypothetical protein
MHQFHKFILSWKSTCFGKFVCPSSGVYSLYTQQWYVSYRFVESCRAGAYAPARQWPKKMYTLFTHQYKGAVCIHFFGPLCICVCVCVLYIIHKVYYMWRYWDMVSPFSWEISPHAKTMSSNRPNTSVNKKKFSLTAIWVYINYSQVFPAFLDLGPKQQCNSFLT